MDSNDEEAEIEKFIRNILDQFSQTKILLLI